jgi:hypothetical protein
MSRRFARLEKSKSAAIGNPHYEFVQLYAHNLMHQVVYATILLVPMHGHLTYLEAQRLGLDIPSDRVVLRREYRFVLLSGLEPAA